MKTFWQSVLATGLVLVLLAAPALADGPSYVETKLAFEAAVEAYEAGLPLTPAQIGLLKQFEYKAAPADGPVIDEAGGPDDLGYMYIDSQEDGGPVFDWIDISTSGTEVSDQLDDDNYIGPFDIGFNFNFYEETYSQFYIQSNGLISFTDEYITLSNYEIPDDGFPAMIAWFWDDLDPDNPDWNDDVGGYTYYETTTVGDQNALVIQFDDWEEFPQGDGVPQIDAQMILFEDGDILINYASVDAGFDIAGGTIGIQNQTGTVGLNVLYNGSVPGYPFGDLSLLFTRGDPDAIVSGTVTSSGNNLPIQGAEVVIGIGTDFTDAGGNYQIDGTYSGPAINVEVSAPGFYEYTGTLALDPGNNTANFQLDALPPPQDEDYFADFEENQGFFSSAGIFQYGEPTVEPGSAHSGTYAWDLALNGEYQNSMDEWLISDTSWLIGEGDPMISYWHWFSFEQNYDGYNFKVSTDGGDSWEVLWPNQGYTDDDGVWGNDNTEPVFTNNTNRHEVWEQVSYNLTPYIGEQVWFAWHAVSDGSVTYPGVCVDDVEILVGNTGPGVDFEMFGVTTIIPPSGGNVVYDVMLQSDFPMTVPGLTFWTKATLPNGQQTQPLMQIPFTHTPFMDVFVTGATQYIPAFAPGGNYQLNGYIGFFPNALDDTGFGFEKIGTFVDGDIVINPADWPATIGEFVSVDNEPEAITVLPDQFEVSDAYPNPFNPSTSISVALPEAAELTVTAYNLAGQQVAVLHQGMAPAGSHTLSFDGAQLASGIYFIQATVPGELNTIRKVTLMK